MYQLNEQQASVGENEELRELITARKGANGHNLANSDCPTLSQHMSPRHLPVCARRFIQARALCNSKNGNNSNVRREMKREIVI